MDESRVPTSGKKKKLVRQLLITFSALSLLIAFFPAIIAGTSLRNLIVNRILGEAGFRATVGEASFGWFSPLSLEDVSLVRTDKRFRLDVERLRAEKSWLQLLWSLPDLGPIEIENPRFDLVLPESHFHAEPEVVDEGLQSALTPLEESKSTLTAVVRNAALHVHSLETNGRLVDIQGLHLGLTIQHSDSGRFLLVQPGTILDHQPLTPEMCAQGLQWVAPVLAGSTRIGGEVSLELMKFSARWDSPADVRDLQVQGVVHLHHVTSQLENPILSIVSGFVSKLFKINRPESIRVVDDSEVAFQVQGGRVSHRGLAFVLPDFSDELVLRTAGTVRFDQSLDLTVEMTLLPKGQAQIPFVGNLTVSPLELRIKGTLDDPHWELPQDRDWIEELARRLLSEEQRDQPKPLAHAIGDLIDGLTNESDRAAETLPGDIMQLIRSAHEARKEYKRRRDKPH